MRNYDTDPELFSEVKETIISKEKWLNALINSMLYCRCIETVAEFVLDHGVVITPRRLTRPSRLQRDCPSSCIMKRSLTTGKPGLASLLQMNIF